MDSVDPCFNSVDDLWAEITNLESLTDILASLGPINIERFMFKKQQSNPSESSRSLIDSSIYTRKMGSVDPWFNSVDNLWAELTNLEQFTALLTSLGPIDIGRFNFNGLDARNLEPLGALVTSLVPLSIGPFDFNGFDAMRIIEAMLTVAKAKKKSIPDFLKDLIDIILIGLTRGNIREDQIGRAVDGDGAERIAERIKELAALYNIPIRANKAVDMSAIIDGGRLTFTRSISVFPHVASLFQHKTTSLARDGWKSSLGTERLPPSMKHTGFSSLIPASVHEVIQAVFLYAHIAYMIDFSRMVNPAHRILPVKDLYNLQSNLCKLAKDNSIFTDAARVSCLVAFGLNTQTNFDLILDVASQLHQEVHSSSLTIPNRSAIFKNPPFSFSFSEP